MFTHINWIVFKCATKTRLFLFRARADFTIVY